MQGIQHMISSCIAEIEFFVNEHFISYILIQAFHHHPHVSTAYNFST